MLQTIHSCVCLIGIVDTAFELLDSRGLFAWVGSVPLKLRKFLPVLSSLDVVNTYVIV